MRQLSGDRRSRTSAARRNTWRRLATTLPDCSGSNKAWASVADAPAAFKHVPARSKDYAPGTRMSYQVAPEDCTGCTLCVDVCPIRDKSNVSHKALNMAPQPPLRAQEAENWDYFLKLPDLARRDAKRTTIPGSMLVTRTPVPARSQRRPSENWRTKALVPPYTLPPG